MTTAYREKGSPDRRRSSATAVGADLHRTHPRSTCAPISVPVADRHADCPEASLARASRGETKSFRDADRTATPIHINCRSALHKVSLQCRLPCAFVCFPRKALRAERSALHLASNYPGGALRDVCLDMFFVRAVYASESSWNLKKSPMRDGGRLMESARVGGYAVLLLGLAVVSTPIGATAKSITVRPGESIQAAIDAAAPGDAVKVLSGDYYETHSGSAAVRITKPLTLIASGTGSHSAVRRPEGRHRRRAGQPG